MWGAHLTQCPIAENGWIYFEMVFGFFLVLAPGLVMGPHAQTCPSQIWTSTYVCVSSPALGNQRLGSHLPTHRKPILKFPRVWRTLWETLLTGLLPRFFSFWTSQDNLVDFLLGSDSCRPWWVPISSQEIVMRMSFLKCRKYWCGPDRCRAFSFCHIGY